MRRPLVGACLGAALALPLAAPAQEERCFDVPLERGQIEEFLRTAEVLDREPIGTGVTRSERLTLSDGALTLRAAWKTINVRQPGLWRNEQGGFEFDFRDSWKSEVAAYELDKLLGTDLVPPAVRRRIDGRLGSVQLWIEDVVTEKGRREQGRQPVHPRARIRWHNQMHCLRLLHQLTYNTDYRNSENVLVDGEFGLYAIDFSRAFRIQRDLLSPDDLSAFSRSVIGRLEKLDRATIEERMGDLLDSMQVEGLLARRDRILNLVRSRIIRDGQGPTFYQ
jgi:hypothetical protein